jgi:hypothetical protein
MVLQRHTTAVVAITLALTAGLAFSASAVAAPPAPADAVVAATHGTALVQPNPDNRAAEAGGASGPCSENCSGGARSYGLTSPLASTASRPGARLPHDPPPLRIAVPTAYGAGSRAPAVVRVVLRSGGFHWGDAGIGAAVAVVLLAVGLAGIRTATHARRRHTGQQRVIATN